MIMNVDELPPQLLRFLVYLLSAGFVVTGTALIGVIIFLARDVRARLAGIEDKSTEQFQSFGKQLHEVRNLVTEDLHKHDVRITRIEEWRKAVERARGLPTDGD